MLRTVNILNGQGGVSRSIADAEKTWKEVSINTEYNCLYTAVCMSKNKHRYKELMENHELLLNQSKKLKFKLKGRFEINPKHTMSNDIEIQMCSDYLKTPIIVYNNLYMKVREFQPKELPKDKRTSAREALEIRISNGHYTSVIRRKDLTDDDLEVKVSQSKPEFKNVDAYLQYECGYVFEMDAETELQVEDTLIVKKTFKQKDNPKKQKRVRQDIYHTYYGAYDIECSPDPDNNNCHKAYACGLSYWTHTGFNNTQFWGMDCQKQFVKYLHDHIKDLHEYTLYAHNKGRYDFQNLFREALCNYDGDLHIKDYIELNGRIISFKLTDGNHYINFRDSVCIFAGQSLDDLTKELDVEHKKLKELVNHKEIYLNNYMSLKNEIEKYLHNDCLGLLECIIKFSKEVFKATSINLSEVFTGATLSKKYFYKKFYNSFKTPIYYLSRMKDEFIRQTYFGGRNEVFKLGAINDKAYYHDFTSLYPAVAQKNLPFDAPMWVKMNSVDKFKKFFGFCDVWVQTKDFTDHFMRLL
jgi:hypothetical protein